MLRKIRSYGILAISLYLGTLGWVSLVFAEAAIAPAQQHEIVQDSSVRDRVMALREERQEQMPYLDRNYINTSINEETIEERRNFTRASGRKNLDSLLARAAEVHTPAKTARERISLAKRRILVALRNLFPEASFEYEDQNGRLSGGAIQPFNSRNYLVTLRQPVFRGGVLWNTLLQEKAELEASEKEYEAALGDLINDVSSAYFEYNRAQEVMNDQQSVIDAMKRFADISEQKFNEGIISEIEHLNVQSLYSQIQYDFETSKQEIEIAKLELQRFLDLEIDQNLSVESLYELDTLLETEAPEAEASLTEEMTPVNDGEYFPSDRGIEPVEGEFNFPSLGDLIDMAYANRPELRVEASRLEAARLEERVRWGELMPRADVILEFGKTGEALDANTTEPSMREDFRLQVELSWNAMGNTVDYTYEKNEQAPSVTQFQANSGSDFRRNNISVGVLDGLDAIADAKEAEVEKLEQIEELEETEKEVVLDVKQSYYDYQKAKIQVRSSLQRVNYRKRLTGLSEFRLGKNEIEISEYLQTEIDLLNELNSLHEALADLYTAKAQLNHAIGISNHFTIEDNHEF